MYAALAYDPSKSSFYRVVRFDQGFRYLNVYNSQTRRWKKLEFWLENDVTKVEWIEKQSVFFQGEIYRLSMSGHLLRFVVDREVSLKDEAQAINLPEVANKLYPKHYCLGLCNDQINFMVFDNELCLCIWVLSSGTYEWSLRRRLSRIHQYFACKNSFFPPLGFHPYMDIVFVGLTSQGLKSSIMKISFGKDTASAFQYSCQDIVRDMHFINWHNAVTFPLFKCSVPFRKWNS
ncbi:hypothetical protein PanWU01x14_015950 [Parasponia andersonii]|uniref:F-box associated domain-containing protein n=1 Tax=Parasponia andersonii TaxID=3476 RepID=A0A2P5E0M0_PARAD|nr:hypothetical protein PanWU01x14_015950 [Parasponia andersonii]